VPARPRRTFCSTFLHPRHLSLVLHQLHGVVKYERPLARHPTGKPRQNCGRASQVHPLRRTHLPTHHTIASSPRAVATAATLTDLTLAQAPPRPAPLDFTPTARARVARCPLRGRPSPPSPRRPNFRQVPSSRPSAVDLPPFLPMIMADVVRTGLPSLLGHSRTRRSLTMPTWPPLLLAPARRCRAALGRRRANSPPLATSFVPPLALAPVVVAPSLPRRPLLGVPTACTQVALARTAPPSRAARPATSRTGPARPARRPGDLAPEPCRQYGQQALRR